MIGEGINKYDIISLTETWHTNNKCIQRIKSNIPRCYCYYENAGKNRNRKSKRNSCVHIIFYKDSLKTFMAVYDKTNENMMWMSKEGINKHSYNIYESNKYV